MSSEIMTDCQTCAKKKERHKAKFAAKRAAERKPSKVCYLSMDRHMSVGFGTVTCTRDKVVIYDKNEHKRNHGEDSIPNASYFEEMATKDPEHVWRIWFDAPRYEQLFGRQEDGRWLLIEVGNGFA